MEEQKNIISTVVLMREYAERMPADGINRREKGCGFCAIRRGRKPGERSAYVKPQQRGQRSRKIVNYG